MIVVAEHPAPDLVAALSAAGAFPIVETNWADAPTAFVAVKPGAIVIAEPGPAPSETAARMLCLQVATLNGPIVPVVARVNAGQATPVPIALSVDADQPLERLVTRLRAALRVRTLHATVLRRLEAFAEKHGKSVSMPLNDVLEEATVLIAGRGGSYPALSVAIGERVGMLGALSVEAAAQHLNSRDVDGIVIGDGFSSRMIEAFLTMLAQDPRFRDMPVALLGQLPPDLANELPNIDQVSGEPAQIIERMVPLVRLHAFDARLKRMLKTLDADGIFDPETGLLTHDAFWRDLSKVFDEATERGSALSVARFSFDGPPLERRASLDGARLVGRLMRNIDFASRDDDGSIYAVFTQTDLRSAHVVVRRIAAVLKQTMLSPHRDHANIAANVTLATFKAGDSLDTLMMRVMGSRAVAAE